MHPRSSLSLRYKNVEPPGSRREQDWEIERGKGEFRGEEREGERKRMRLEGSKGDDVIRVRRVATLLYPRWRFQRHFDGETLPPVSPFPLSSYSPSCCVRSRFVLSTELPHSLFLSFSFLRNRSLLVVLLFFHSLARLHSLTILFLFPSLSPVKRPVQLWRGYT